MNISVCLSVCLSASISRELYVRVSPIFAHADCIRGSLLLCRRCRMLCASGFVDNVIFAHNWPYGTGIASGVQANDE